MNAKLKRTLFIAIPVVVAVAAVIYMRHTPKPGDEAADKSSQAGRQGAGQRKVPVDVYLVDYIRIDEGIRSVGTLLPNESLDIASEVAGKVEKISFEEGGQVKKGQLLVKINDEDLQLQLRRAQFQRNLTKEKLDRSRILLDKDAISRESFDQVETDYNMIEADIALLEVRIDKTNIKAPFDGVVGFRYVSLGSYLQPGTKIAHMVDNSRLKIEFSIPEKYYSELLRGSYVTFSTESDPRPRTARVYAIDPTVDAMTRTVVLRAMYENSGMKIIPGMFASVVAGQKSGTSLQVPTEAIVPSADQKTVWVVEGGRAHSRAVTTGVRGETMIEITSGLVRGDSVVVTGLLQVKEGSPLVINN